MWKLISSLVKNNSTSPGTRRRGSLRSAQPSQDFLLGRAGALAGLPGTPPCEGRGPRRRGLGRGGGLGGWRAAGAARGAGAALGSGAAVRQEGGRQSGVPAAGPISRESRTGPGPVHCALWGLARGRGAVLSARGPAGPGSAPTRPEGKRPRWGGERLRSALPAVCPPRFVLLVASTVGAPTRRRRVGSGRGAAFPSLQSGSLCCRGRRGVAEIPRRSSFAFRVSNSYRLQRPAGSLARL